MPHIVAHIFSIVWIIAFAITVHALGVALITFSWDLLLVSGSVFVFTSFAQIIIAPLITA
ncbi:MAG TPA: hypothetical protein VJH33_00765 [Candidatus Paceibacterota bacterium]